ncbi:MAG: TIGR03086 family protein [Actinobacteria bacterium]|nr:TIGR03086 family protein [Actinomycetota bacterium]
MSTEQLQQAFASTRGVLAQVTAAQLDLPTPCQSWDVRGLVNHIVGGSRWFGASVEAGKSVDEFAAGEWADGDFVASFDEGVERTVAAFGAPGAQEKMIELPFGTFPGAVFMGLATSDTFTHGWDLARATGQSTDLDPALADALLAQARMSIPEAFRGADGVAPFGRDCSMPRAGCTEDRSSSRRSRSSTCSSPARSSQCTPTFPNSVARTARWCRSGCSW